MARRANAAGSVSRSQRTLGSVNPSRGGFETQARSDASSTLAAIARHWAVVRPSHQRSAGRITLLSASRKTDECIWPDKPTASIFFLADRALHGGLRRLPPVGGALLGPAGLGHPHAERLGGAGDRAPAPVDDERLDVAGADVDAEEERIGHAIAHRGELRS